MRVALLTREYPPEVYGGAGVHVEYLATELARTIPVEVRCFGAPRQTAEPNGARPIVRSYRQWEDLAGGSPHGAALRTMSVNLAMADGLGHVSLVHSHTWYANLGGHLAKLVHGIPHVATTHSLEPLRPWKAEQLGAGGYALSSFCERTALEGADAVIAVSGAMRNDILRCYPNVDSERVNVIHNGIDPGQYRPDPHIDVLEEYGVDPAKPAVVFVGRITRQKGIVHLLDAALHIGSDAQLVLCAGAPDTPELYEEVVAGVDRLRRRRGTVVWIDTMLSRREVIQILSHATVFCCPSIYEPLGIVNLEAMACETAVVATATGGIPEVVDEAETGFLVPFDPTDEVTHTPRDREWFAHDIAERINALLANPEKAKRFGRAGRRRVQEAFTWSVVAKKTVALYERVMGT
jgi:alpha-maltose-1-phosphate synthase